jgi:hypothetical protein
VPTLELKPRHGTEIVDAAFQLYRQHFRALLMLNAIVYGPYVLLEYLFRGELADTAAPSLALLFVPLIGLIIGSLAEAAIVLAVSNSYLRGDPDPMVALRSTLRRFGAILLSVSIKYFLIGLGLIVSLFVVMIPLGIVMVALRGTMTESDNLMVVGALGLIFVIVAFAGALPVALYIFARYFAVPATVILEGVGVRAGLRRSSELSRDIKRKIVGTLALPFIIVVIIQFIVMALAEQLPGPDIVSFLISQLPPFVLTPILAVIATLLYYDARIRKEGFDIEMMAAELGSAEPGGSPRLPVSP